MKLRHILQDTIGTYDCLDQIAIECGILNRSMKSAMFREFQNGLGLRKVIVHLEEANQNYRLHLSSNVQGDQSAAKQYFFKVGDDSMSAYFTVWMECLFRCDYSAITMAQGINRAFMKLTMCGLYSTIYSEFLEKRCANSSHYNQCVDGNCPPRRIRRRLSSFCRFLSSNKHSGVYGWIGDQSFPSLIEHTVAIKGAA